MGRGGDLKRAFRRAPAMVMYTMGVLAPGSGLERRADYSVFYGR
jgi:hypothetical protein